jgi:hypothetical protein
MPVCCNVLRKEMLRGKAEIVLRRRAETLRYLPFATTFPGHNWPGKTTHPGARVWTAIGCACPIAHLKIHRLEGFLVICASCILFRTSGARWVASTEPNHGS